MLTFCEQCRISSYYRSMVMLITCYITILFGDNCEFSYACRNFWSFLCVTYITCINSCGVDLSFSPFKLLFNFWCHVILAFLFCRIFSNVATKYSSSNYSKLLNVHKKIVNIVLTHKNLVLLNENFSSPKISSLH
jgi:hypothetical protein